MFKEIVYESLINEYSFEGDITWYKIRPTIQLFGCMDPRDQIDLDFQRTVGGEWDTPKSTHLIDWKEFVD